MKVGRNDRCPCGSGHKFKHCCGATAPAQWRYVRPRPFRELPVEVRRQIQMHEAKERLRIQEFGQGKPIISWESHGYRIVAVGSTVRWSKNWKTVDDFLCFYIKQCIGPDWGNAELKKPFEQRHPIIQWYRDVCELQARTIKERGKVFSAIAAGPVRAYLSLAYDLCTLEHNSLLHKKLVERVKRKDQIHGVRYEIAVAATFIRAGFDIEFENEDDSTVSHCEFSATHRATHAQFSVEAKSRGRPGVLGKPGNPEPFDKIKADVYRLLQEALMKRARHARIIFVDVNMPPLNGQPYDSS